MKRPVSFIHLSPQMSNALLQAAAFMEVEAAWDGRERHRRLEMLSRSLDKSPAGAPEALLKNLWAGTPGRKSTASKTAQKAITLFETWKAMGVEVVACRFPSGHPLEGCPKFLFALGAPPEASLLLSAAFNSRKGKPTRRADPWVHALRRVFLQTAQEPLAWVSSFGTALYDMVTCWAHVYEKPTVLYGVASASGTAWDHFLSAFPGLDPRWFLSCLPGRAACPSKTLVLCRDRLVAAAADQWYVIEIRKGGNLVRVLSEELSERPRPVWVFPARAGAPETEGNTEILETFPRQARIWPGDHGPHGRFFKRVHRRAPKHPPVACTMPATDEPFLFHYTRSCPGPWPGQARCAWAEELLRATPWADHTALDTLWRILTERRLRSCGRLIRGQIPVVSWTSVPPEDLARLTRWNPALIRWTFEPYGVAVKRKVLKTLGARPAVYAREADYPKIPQRERFRFQLHEPHRPSWKREKEWRLAGDLDLDALNPNDWWAFVPTLDEARWLEKHVPRPCRIMALHSTCLEKPE